MVGGEEHGKSGITGQMLFDLFGKGASVSHSGLHPSHPVPEGGVRTLGGCRRAAMVQVCRAAAEPGKAKASEVVFAAAHFDVILRLASHCGRGTSAFDFSRAMAKQEMQEEIPRLDVVRRLTVVK